MSSTDRLPVDEASIGFLPDTNDLTKSQLNVLVDVLYNAEELLFSGLASDEVFFKCPDRLRLPLIFYFGHTSAVFVNKMRVARLIQYNERVNVEFEDILETGVDEMSWDDVENMRMGGAFKWPSVGEIRKYRDEVKSLVHKVIDRTELRTPIPHNDAWEAVLMGIEHFRIHLETSAVLIQQLPITMVSRPVGWKYGSFKSDAVKNEMVAVEGKLIKYGKPYSFPTFGWDNEYGQASKEVRSFKVFKFKVTNEEFLDFVTSGCYAKEQFWTEEGWQWRQFTLRCHPLFWVCDKGCKTSCGKNVGNVTHCDYKLCPKPEGIEEHLRPDFPFKYRLLFDVIDMPENWPVLVNYYEAKAFCAWRGKEFRLPSEAEFRLMQSVKIRKPCQRSDDPTTCTDLKANINLAFGSCTPVNKYPPNSQGIHDCFGNAWEWTEDHFDGLPGTRYSIFYGDFSSPCYDGKHNIILGGSFMSTGSYASYFARVGFRRHFQQFAGFRMLSSTDESCIHHVDNESESTATSAWVYRFDNNKLLEAMSLVEDSRSYQRLLQYVCDLPSLAGCSRPTTLLHIGCGVGMLTLKLAPKFDEVIGIDVQSVLINQCSENGEKFSQNGVIFRQLTWLPNDMPKADVALLTMYDHFQDKNAWLLRLEDQIKIGGSLVALLEDDSVISSFEKFIGPRFCLDYLEGGLEGIKRDASDFKNCGHFMAVYRRY